MKEQIIELAQQYSVNPKPLAIALWHYVQGLPMECVTTNLYNKVRLDEPSTVVLVQDDDLLERISRIYGIPKSKIMALKQY